MLEQGNNKMMGRSSRLKLFHPVLLRRLFIFERVQASSGKESMEMDEELLSQQIHHVVHRT